MPGACVSCYSLLAIWLLRLGKPLPATSELGSISECDVSKWGVNPCLPCNKMQPSGKRDRVCCSLHYLNLLIAFVYSHCELQ